MDDVIEFAVSEDSALKIKSKLGKDKITLMETYLRQENFDEFLDLINQWDLNYKSINQVRHSISKNTPSMTYQWGINLLGDNRVSSLIVAGLMMIKAEIWNRDLEKTLEIIEKFSEFEEWRVRGVGINLFSHSLIKRYPDFKDIFKKFINSDSSKLRRVAISTSQEISLYKGKITFMDKDFLDLLTPYLTEKDPYVSSVSNETFGNYIKNYPDLFYEWIGAKSDVITDDFSKASILYILSNFHATKHLDKSCKIIDKFILEDDGKIKRARSAALRNLAKYHSKNISSWLEKRMNIPQAVDHWSELQIDGLLETLY